MSLTFLCPTHRDWVYFNPQEALLQIEKNQQQGERLMQARDWEQAKAYLDCAFETTEIIMDLQNIQQSFLVSRLTSLAVLLSESFNQRQTFNIGKLVLQQTEKKLQRAVEKDIDNQPRQAYIKQCIENIRFYIEGYNLDRAWNNSLQQLH